MKETKSFLTIKFCSLESFGVILIEIRIVFTKKTALEVAYAKPTIVSFTFMVKLKRWNSTEQNNQ